jgi:hypothetical protein
VESLDVPNYAAQKGKDPSADHFATLLLAAGLTIDGMESCEDFFQLIQAQPAHSALQAMASATAAYPNGREMNNTAGLKRKATASKATVVVYPVPVDF